LLLTKDGVNPDPTDEFGQTPLLWAAANGHKSVVKLLLAKENINPNCKDTHAKYSQTPLAWAAKKGLEAAVQLLLAKDGVDWHCKDNASQTPLSLAEKEGHEAVVKLLQNHS